MRIILTDALEKIFSNDVSLPPCADTLYLTQGESGAVQLAVEPEREGELRVSAEGAAARIFLVQEIPAGLAAYPDAEKRALLRGGEPGLYPDLLQPADVPVHVLPGQRAVFFIRLFTDGLSAGVHEAALRVSDGEDAQTVTLTICVAGHPLPPQTLIHTDWFHADCLASYYKLPVFSEAHWRVMEAFLQNAASYGVNCILTPLFTPPLDTEVGGERPTVQLVDVTCGGGQYQFDLQNLRRFVRMAQRCGIRYFEFSHFFTQWGARHAPKVAAHTPDGVQRIFGWETDALSDAYLDFLRRFGKALTAFCDAEQITDRCFVHCSDEPGLDDLPQYAAASKAIRSYFPAFRHIDALSDPAFFEKGLVQIPVPEEGSIEAFYGKTAHLWTYYCCGQYRDCLPNRFFSMPSVRCRMLGVLLYLYDCEGFLHWGYNFYYSRYSRRLIDPFTETDADGAFPAGDAFVVYPGKNGEPLSSLRQQVFFDGLQDLRALRCAEALTSRAQVLHLIKETLGDVSFRSFPIENEKYLAFKKRLYAFLQAQ